MTPRACRTKAAVCTLAAVAAALGAATVAARAAPTAATAASASASSIAPATPSDSLPAFLQGWRDAAARPGGEAIADLTAWPFLFQGRALQRQEFVAKAVPALFTPAVRRCLQRAQPLAEDGRQILSCAPYGFVLAHTAAGWRLVEFFADTP